VSQFWLLTAASSVSKMGNTFLRLAVPLAILQTTGSPAAAILSVALENLPYLAGPVLGTLIDRFPRRTVFAVSELSQAVLVVLVTVALGAHRVDVIYVLLLLLGFGSVISNITSEFSLIPSLAPADKVGAAYSRYMTCVDTARFAGPLLGGLLISVTSTQVALLFDAATFVLTAAVVWTLRVGREREPQAEGFVTSLVRGWRVFLRLPGIPRLTATLALFNLGAGSIATVLLAVGTAEWHWSPSLAGGVISAGSIAGAAGAAVTARVGASWTWARRILLWMAASAAFAGLLVVGQPHAAIAGFVGMSFASGAMNVATMAFRHDAIPTEFTGRVNTVIRSLVMGSIPASALLLSWTSRSDNHFVMLSPALLFTAAAVVLWASGRISVRASPAISPEPVERREVVAP